MQINIQGRFNGPVGMGNGGYVCGSLAKHLPASRSESIRVSLKAPCPLDKTLDIQLDGMGAVMLDGDQKIAVGEAGLDPIADLPPMIPSLVDSRAASDRFFVNPDEMYQQCFVCGKKRTEDGLCLFAGTVGGHPDVVATPWTPAAEFIDENGIIRSEIIWAALDCPGYFACSCKETSLLAAMQAQILDELKPGEVCRVIGWDKRGGDRSGRKRLAGTAIIGADDRLIAVADQMWIILK